MFREAQGDKACQEVNRKCSQTGGLAAGTHRVPQRHLSLTHATEAGGEDLPIGHKDRPDWSEAFVRLLLLLELEQRTNFID